MIVDAEEHELKHYGILRRSGRYPWGSGSTLNKRSKTFLDIVAELKKEGMSDTEIARGFGMSRNQLNANRSIALNQQKQAKIAQVEKYAAKGMSNVEIGRRMGLNESSIRALRAPGEKEKLDILTSTAEMLKRQVDEKGMIDVGRGVHLDLPIGDGGNIGISDGKFKTALAMVQELGYKLHYLKQPQQSTGHDTLMKVLTKPDITYGDVSRNRSNIKLITEKSDNHGRNWMDNEMRPPTSMSSKRIQVKYKEDGGAEADGVMYIRRGAKDLDMGNASYAQVRIAVDKTHYLKGMAVYKDDLPPGVDIVFNTNKSKTVPMKHSDPKANQVLKPMERKPDGTINLESPFTSAIKRDGQRGHLNIVNEEGDWDNWSRNLSAQMLSKQKPELAKQQLGMTQERRRNQFDEIMSLTNPSIKKRLLETFADETDSSATHLDAAALPKTNNKVLLPVKSVKPREIYAPSYDNGDRVALIRHPHGGTFEIPELTVNNRNPEARKILGSHATDAVAIHHSVAERLSGADFDGDHVLVIPNRTGSIKTTPALEGLKGFDPQQFKRDPASGSPRVTNKMKQPEMGKISNLITDMTIKGAGPDDIARAIKHSMVVIDAEKHDLDIRRSARENGILQLKQKYQGGTRAGASTLVSRSRSPQHIPHLKPRPVSEGGPIDRATGRKVFVPSGKTRLDRKTGEQVPVLQRSKLLDLEPDARKLVSTPGTRIEHVYADHSNQLKSLANQARKESLKINLISKSRSAEATYAREVSSLNAQLNNAKKNAPLERQAQRLAGKVVSQKRQAKPDMDPDELKKIRTQSLDEMRIRTGAKKHQIRFSQSEWDAIQAGAVAPSRLKEILDHADLDAVKKMATPRTTKLMTSSKTARAKAMLSAGYTQAEVARHLGVSLTTLKEGIV